MDDTTKMKLLISAALAGVLLATVPAAFAGEPDKSADIERARKEVDKAREELRRATRELASSMAKLDRNNPRAQYFEFMTNPKRAVLGVIIDDESGEDRGVMVLAATPGGGAEKAGLKAGDILLALDGNSLAAKGNQPPAHHLRGVLRKLEAGVTVKVEYLRDGKRTKTTLKTQAPETDFSMSMIPPMPPQALMEMDEEDFKQFMPFDKKFGFFGGPTRGMELCKLDDDLAGYFKTKDGVLVIKAPKEKSFGLKSGDVIQRIGGDKVSEPVTVMDKLRSRGEAQTVKIEVLRQGKKITLNATLPVADARRIEKRFEITIDDDDN